MMKSKTVEKVRRGGAANLQARGLVQVNLVLSMAQRELLRKEAKRKGTSMNGYAVNAIFFPLMTTQKAETPRPRKQRGRKGIDGEKGRRRRP